MVIVQKRQVWTDFVGFDRATHADRRPGIAPVADANIGWSGAACAKRFATGVAIWSRPLAARLEVYRRKPNSIVATSCTERTASRLCSDHEQWRNAERAALLLLRR